jgi:hypothetical protein
MYPDHDPALLYNEFSSVLLSLPMLQKSTGEPAKGASSPAATRASAPHARQLSGERTSRRHRRHQPAPHSAVVCGKRRTGFVPFLERLSRCETLADVVSTLTPEEKREMGVHLEVVRVPVCPQM